MSLDKYAHISFEERVVIENRLESGESLRKIAKCLDRATSSLSRELVRNGIKIKRSRANKPRLPLKILIIRPLVALRHKDYASIHQSM